MTVAPAPDPELPPASVIMEIRQLVAKGWGWENIVVAFREKEPPVHLTKADVWPFVREWKK